MEKQQASIDYKKSKSIIIVDKLLSRKVQIRNWNSCFRATCTKTTITPILR